jgi:Zn-dependent protease
MSEPPASRPAKSSRASQRPWSLFIGRVAGIPIYLHFTFLLLLAFIAFTGGEAFGGLALVLLVFGSVVLHELGHAMMARRFGIHTDDIVLYPIGGVARLRSMGKGFQEFWIALAGPAVNVVIAAALFVLLKATGWWVPWEEVAKTLEAASPDAAPAIDVPMLQFLFSINLMLLVFNLIPAFPMDGGRLLRALLATRLPHVRATEIAAMIGQGFALLFMVAGVTWFSQNPLLLIIGIFIFFAAGQESAATRSTSLLSGHRVGDAMITNFETLNHGDSLGRAADLLLTTNQHDFPVLGGSQVIGVLGRKALITGLSTHGRDHYVAEVMARAFPAMHPGEPLEKALDGLRSAEGLPILVFEGERLVGYIDQENLAEYLMIAQTRPQAGRPA